jgi:hypothetical protein
MRRVRIVHAVTFDTLQTVINNMLAALEREGHTPVTVRIGAVGELRYACIIYEPKPEEG